MEYDQPDQVTLISAFPGDGWLQKWVYVQVVYVYVAPVLPVSSYYQFMFGDFHESILLLFQIYFVYTMTIILYQRLIG